MFKIFFSTFFIITILCALPDAHGQLRVLGDNEISLGKIYQSGVKVRKRVTVENTGSERITINRVNTSCGCTAAMISDSTLDPGGRAEIEIEFDPTGYMGEITKYIYISTSDPKYQLVTFRMTGYVADALQPTPNTVSFNQTKVGVTDSSSITLNNTSDEPIRIKKVETPNKEITYKLDKKILKPGEFTDLHFYLRLRKEENISGFIRIVSTSKLQPVLQVRIFSGGTIFR